MRLDNHLLYIDITNKCNLNCEFCMYKEVRKENPLDLKLSVLAKKNITNLLNHPETERLIISGEGEPFSNPNAVFEILKLSKGNKKIQIISNGLWTVSDKFYDHLKKLKTLQLKKRDRYQIRISCDTFHISRIGKENYKRIIKKIVDYNKKEKSIEICFRGILEEKTKILSMIKNEFLKDTNEVAFKETNPLETEVIIDNKIKINFIFKNLIDLDNLKKQKSLKKYINSLEKIYDKPFTLGHLKKGNNGMDITIKPNGNLFFYGAEIYSIFNIYNDSLTIEMLKNILEKNCIFKKLYTIPFKKIIRSLNKFKPFKDIISSVNNPYWIVKKMYSYDKNKFEELIKC